MALGVEGERREREGERREGEDARAFDNYCMFISNHKTLIYVLKIT